MQMFQKAPSVETYCLRKPQFQNNQVSTICHIPRTVVNYCDTHTPATQIHRTVISMDMMSLRHSITFTKRDGMIAGCIFILLHSHGASWMRLSKNSCQNNNKPHYHIYQHNLLHHLYVVSAFHIQNEGKSMNITFMPTRLPHLHHQRIWKSLLLYIY
jgi:hypothetical protein